MHVGVRGQLEMLVLHHSLAFASVCAFVCESSSICTCMYTMWLFACEWAHLCRYTWKPEVDAGYLSHLLFLPSTLWRSAHLHLPVGIQVPVKGLALWVVGIKLRSSKVCTARMLLTEPSSQPRRENSLEYPV